MQNMEPLEDVSAVSEGEEASATRMPEEPSDTERAGAVTIGGSAVEAGPGLAGVLDRAVPILVLVALLLHPTQIGATRWLVLLAEAVGLDGLFQAAVATQADGSAVSLRSVLLAVNMTVSDVLLLLAFVGWTASAWRERRLRHLPRFYPAGVVVLLAAALLSALPFLKPSGIMTGRTFSPGSAFKQCFQLFLFFVASLGVMADYLSRRAWKGRLMAAVLVAGAVCVALGLVEYAQLRPAGPGARDQGALLSVMQVDGTFGFRAQAAGAHEQVGTASSRNMLGAWLTLVLPLAWATFLFGRRAWVRGVSLALTAGGALLLLHGALWAIAVLAMLCLAWVRGRAAFAATAAGLFVLFSLAFMLGPQQHGYILLDSLMPSKRSDRFRELPLYEIDPPLDRSSGVADLTQPGYSTWQQKYVEWQPALQALGRNPLFGVGAGNYQANINAFYEGQPADSAHNPARCYLIEKPRKNLMEVDGNPFYRVWMVETGLAGLLAFACLLMSALGHGRRTLPATEAGASMDRALKLGAIAALASACAGMLFVNYWVRGVGIAYALVLALCVAEPVEREKFMPASEEVTQV